MRPPTTAPTVTGVDGAGEAWLLVAAADGVVVADDADSETVLSAIAIEVDEVEDAEPLLDGTLLLGELSGPAMTGA